MALNQEQSNSGMDFSKDYSSPTNASPLGKSRMSSGRKSAQNNEFLTNQLDPSRVNEYIAMLSEFEKTSISERKFKDAELAAIRIEELKQQEIEYRTVVREEQTMVEIEDLERMNASQAEEFNRQWDRLIQEHVEQMKNIEVEMIMTHEEEVRRFDEEVDKLVIPNPKFSTDILNMQHMINGLIRTKKYSEAEDLTNRMEKLQRKETQRWNDQFREKYIRKRQLLLARQKTELQVLQERLQNSLHEKLRMRVTEQDKLFKRFQNLKNELELKQSHDLSKLNLLSNKVKKVCTLAADLPKTPSNKSFLASSKLETSKLISQSRND